MANDLQELGRVFGPDCLSTGQLRNINLHGPLLLPGDMVKDEDRVLDERETMLLRGAGGSLLWIGRESRPDVAAARALAMAWGKEGPKVRHLTFANQTQDCPATQARL